MATVSDWTVALRFRVSPADAQGFLARGTECTRVLAAAEGCRGVELGRASDDAHTWLLCSRWRSVGDYRRALSSYQVKLEVVPFLSTAIDEPTAFEVLFAVDADGERAASGDLASDAGTIDRSR